MRFTVCSLNLRLRNWPHRHYVGLNTGDGAGALVRIQLALTGLMGNAKATSLESVKILHAIREREFHLRDPAETREQ